MASNNHGGGRKKRKNEAKKEPQRGLGIALLEEQRLMEQQQKQNKMIIKEEPPSPSPSPSPSFLGMLPPAKFLHQRTPFDLYSGTLPPPRRVLEATHFCGGGGGVPTPNVETWGGFPPHQRLPFFPVRCAPPPQVTTHSVNNGQGQGGPWVRSGTPFAVDTSSIPDLNVPLPPHLQQPLHLVPKIARYNELDNVKGSSNTRRDNGPGCYTPQPAAPNLNGGNSDFFYNKPASDHDEDVEIVWVQRKGNPMGGNSNNNNRVITEYEFMPPKEGTDTDAATNTDTIDLSLKLSR